MSAVIFYRQLAVTGVCGVQALTPRVTSALGCNNKPLPFSTQRAHQKQGSEGQEEGQV